MAIASKGYRYARCGPIASVLKLESFNVTIGNVDSDVIIKMSHAPIHRTDAAIVNGTALGRNTTTQATGTPTVKPPAFPRIAGFEGIGVVVDAGRSKRVKAGDTVWLSPSAGVGTWATHVVANSEHVHRVPAQISRTHHALASCATALITGRQLLSRDTVKISQGDVVIINGGSSLTALVAATVAKKAGATVIGAATAGDRFGAAKSRLSEAGAATIVEYSAKGALTAKQHIGDRRVALFANGVGGGQFNDFARLVGAQGACVTYGAQSGFGIMWAGGHQIVNGSTHQGFFAPRHLANLSYDARQKVFEDALELATIKYPVQEVKALEDLSNSWDSMYLDGGKKHVFVF